MSRRPGRVLLVASAGGHLEELYRLRTVLAGTDEQVTWITFDTPQVETMLAGQDVRLLLAIPSRGYREVLGNIPRAARLLLAVRPRRIISTGSGIALVFLPFAFLVGARGWYVESAARVDGPSMTGRLLSLLPWVRTTTQYESLTSRRWRLGPSVFDAWNRRRADDLVTSPNPKVFVMLGTQGYEFGRLIEAVRNALPPGSEVVWQLGHTPAPPDLPGEVHDWIRPTKIAEIVKRSTAVVTHAGVGCALTSLEGGVRPILVPRRRAAGEHVDDHQVQLARELGKREVAVACEPEQISEALLRLDYREESTPIEP